MDGGGDDLFGFGGPGAPDETGPAADSTPRPRDPAGPGGDHGPDPWPPGWSLREAAETAVPDGKADVPHHVGHRERLREKFRRLGGEVMEDYELLELVLTIVLPRQDVKPLAKRLIGRFGSFAAVFHADQRALAHEKGLADVSAASLKIIKAAAVRLVRDDIRNGPIINSWDRLLDYCMVAMAHEKVEQFRILFLDSKLKLIVDEVQQRGTIDQAPVYPREVVRRALELNAATLIIVHNHPSGDPTPSTADREITRQIRDALKGVDIRLQDHLVVGREGILSFRNKGLL